MKSEERSAYSKEHRVWHEKGVRMVAVCRLEGLIGESIWFRSPKQKINKGIIAKISGMDQVQIETDNGRQPVHISDMFLTRWDLLAALRKN